MFKVIPGVSRARFAPAFQPGRIAGRAGRGGGGTPSTRAAGARTAAPAAVAFVAGTFRPANQAAEQLAT